MLNRIIYQIAANSAARKLISSPKALLPGISVCTVVAISAQFVSDHYGAPAMLIALLLGIAFHFLAEEGRCTAGIEFTSRTLLRLGVALLGARISLELIYQLGGSLVAILIGSMIVTIVFGLVVSHLLGRGWRFGVLTGGAVAICGASAALAISSTMPANRNSENNLIFTILAVTILSTIAMIVYPIIFQALDLNDLETGIALGATIHDVAQVVGAGYSVSNETGDTATITKLVRVSFLAPFILFLSLLFLREKNAGAKRSWLKNIPLFVIGFFALGAANSLNLIPEDVRMGMERASSWLLVIAITAVGMKSSLKQMFEIGSQAIILIIAETLFLAVIVLTAMHIWSF